MTGVLVRRPERATRREWRRVAIALVAMALAAVVWRPVRGILIDALGRASIGYQDRRDLVLAALRRTFGDAIPASVMYSYEIRRDPANAAVGRGSGLATCGVGRWASACWIESIRDGDPIDMPLDCTRRMALAGPDLRPMGALTIAPSSIQYGAWDMDGDGFLETIPLLAFNFGGISSNDAHFLVWPVVRLESDRNAIVGIGVHRYDSSAPQRLSVIPVATPRRRTDASSTFRFRKYSYGSTLGLRSLNMMGEVVLDTRWDRAGGVLVTEFNDFPNEILFWTPPDGPVYFDQGEVVDDVVERVFKIPEGFGAAASQPATSPAPSPRRGPS